MSTYGTVAGEAASRRAGWEGASGAVAQVVLGQSERCLRSYEANPALVEEHSNIERSTTQGGYGHRQLYELVQNGADELQKEPGGGIHVVLTATALYCANLGTPVTPEGAETILASHLSRKRGTEIGRFGLGFKSVLSISDRPRFYSRSGSFGWDATQAREVIRARVPGEGPTPVLRVAQLLDVEVDRREDAVLDELMSWATTVVKLPLKSGGAAWLAKDVTSFPAEFAIFSPHVGELILDHRRPDEGTARRAFYVRGDGHRRTLSVDEAGEDKTSDWMVFEKVHSPSERAKQEAGEFHGRDQIPVAWAVPVSGQHGPGRFWAFFPTTYETTLRGVLNAPWKTNEDRQNLLKDNAFNEELMAVSARLIVDSLPHLSTDADPARHLTLITARGRESRNWADGMLTDLVYEFAARSPSLPDQDKMLRRPRDLKMHPTRLDPRWLAQWAAYPGRPSDWVHHSVEETVRRSRAEIILDRAEVSASTVRQWLEALVVDGTAKASAAALSIYADMVLAEHPARHEAGAARILRTADGRMVSPTDGSVYRRTPMDQDADDLTFVDPQLEDDPQTAATLTFLGIREADAFGRFVGAVANGFGGYDDAAWQRLWLLIRQAGVERAVRHLDDRNLTRLLKVRTRGGAFRTTGKCLLPGRVVTPGGDTDADVAVDDDFHEADLALLRKLGMSDVPRAAVDPADEYWFGEYREQALSLYYKKLPADAGRPAETSIVVTGPQPAGSLGLLPRLSEDARARFLTSLPTVGMVAQWHVYAKTRPTDKPIGVVSPLVWIARRHGVLPTSLGRRPVTVCVGPALRGHARVLPVAPVSEELAAVLRLPDTVESIKEATWEVLFEEAATGQDAAVLGEFYALAETVLTAPEQMRCRAADGWTASPTGEVAVAVDRAQYERLLANDVPAVLAPDPDAAARLAAGWGLLTFEQAIVTELNAVPADDLTPLEDVFPRLRVHPGKPLKGLQLQRCSHLEEVVRTPKGLVSSPLEVGRGDGVVYWCSAADDLTLLGRLNTMLGLGLSEQQRRDVLRHRDEMRTSQKVVQVRQQKDDADRLRTMLPAKVLKEKIPQAVIEAVEAVEGSLDDRAVAELAVTVYGTSVLREFRKELEDGGFELPAQMAGGQAARKLVTNLGFDAEFAGTQRPSLEPTLVVQGPVDFPQLHDYQERMVQRMCEVLQSRPAQRGMLTLPTGAGKTRVAVEALTRTLSALPPENSSRPVLWIGQSEELCEQAVQSWQFIWQNIGPARRLTISRLWAGNSADPVQDGFHLVVATDAKLEDVIQQADYAWLRDAQAVIIDEAHTSISQRYTAMLDALGLNPHRTRCPLIGLSATPFRGTSEVETDRLAARYQRNRLDVDRDGTGILGEDPYFTLQQLGVLAEVEHRELLGTTVVLTADEQANFAQLRRLPSSVEERLGHDQQRTQMILDTVLGLPEDWSVLLFATSVSHAQTMAALLNRKGVSAAAVSGNTDVGVRRDVIEKFRRRKIRVLTNYNVLSQGFDAPATRAVIVARPTFSPNLYQQMIGRGLRGPKNGGKDKCLIVNVADNIAQYGDELAFRQFEDLWRKR